MQEVPLNKLVASPLNVRSQTNAEADAELKAGIAARGGVLQNLIVRKAKRGKYEVIAGGRRHRALNELSDEKVIKKTHPVGVDIRECSDAEAIEISLQENVQRLAMNPAEECTSFKSIIDAGGTEQGVADRFGLTLRHVQGRLRLADLAEPVFNALHDGDITLDMAKAYGATADVEVQAHVFDQLSGSTYGHTSDGIRRLVLHQSTDGSDPQAQFVGSEAYIEAGGRIERDLFAKDESEQWLDPAILERLALEKLVGMCAAQARYHGLGWLRPLLGSYAPSADDLEGLQRVHFDPLPLSDEDNARIDTIDMEYEELQDRINAADTTEESWAAAEAKIEALEIERRALTDRPPFVPDNVRASVGAFLSIDRNGEPVIRNGLFSTAPVDAVLDTDSQTVGDQNGEGLTPADQTGGKPDLSQRLRDELAMQRRDVLSANLLGDPALALDFLIFTMAERAARSYGGDTGTTIDVGRASGPIGDFKPEDTAATKALAEATEALDRSWTEPEAKSDRLVAFRALSDEAKASWMTVIVALSLEASCTAYRAPKTVHEVLAESLEIDVAAWWRPTSENYFDRVKKGISLDALTEVGGADLALRYAKGKKAELSTACQKIFSGDFIEKVEVKEAAIKWLPPEMLFGPAGDEEPEKAETGADLNEGSGGAPAATNDVDAESEQEITEEAA